MNKVLSNKLEDSSCLALPNEDSLPWQVNHCWQKQHTKDPTNLEFDIDESDIPENFFEA